MSKERIRMTKIEVQVEPPRVTNGGLARLALYARAGCKW